MLKRVERWSRWTIIITLILLPWTIYGAINLPVGSASLHKWLPDGLEERKGYERFLKEFGDDQLLIVSWDNCDLSDPRVNSFRELLQSEDANQEPFVLSVITTADIIQSLTSEPLRLSMAQAKSRLKGFLMGADGTCALVIRFTNHGIDHQKAAIAHVFWAADHVPDLGRPALRMAGTIYESFAVDEASENSLKKLVVPSCLLGMFLSWICLRSIRQALTVLVIAGFGQIVAIALVYYTGGFFSAVLIVLPTLVFMLTLSGAVHLMSYLGDVSEWHNDHLGARAMLLGLKPSVLASITTSLGMAALATSQLAPVREFGLYSAFSLSLATVFMLLGFPKLTDWFCNRKSNVVHEEESELPIQEQNIVDAASHPAHISPLARGYVTWMQRHAILVASTGVLMMIVSFIGFLNLKSSTKFGDMFPRKSAVVRDMAWVEEHLGPIASVEVLVNFPSTSALNLMERAEWVERVVKQIKSSPDVGGVMSGLTFMPPRPKSGSLRDVVKRSAIGKQMESHVSKLQDAGWIANGESGQSWRITAKVSAIANENYGVLVDRIRTAVNALEVDQANRPFRAEYTGLSPIMHKTQLMLLSDLGASFSIAFLLITPVMMLIARGFWAGLLIMIPNVLPETLVFGTMAWLGYQLDVAGLLTASVAMGIAVNDTLHFVNWYARRLSLGDDRAQAISDSLTSCAGAMFHTMLISCCSMLPFLLAEFMPTRQFACLMIAMLSSAILGDLVLLPALLMSPLGLCLIPKKHRIAKELTTAA